MSMHFHKVQENTLTGIRIKTNQIWPVQGCRHRLVLVVRLSSLVIAALPVACSRRTGSDVGKKAESRVS